MRYIGFTGVAGSTLHHHVGGWKDAVGGGDDKDAVERETAAAAKALLDSFNADVKRYISVWYHVVDLEQGEIIIESGFFDPNRTTMPPTGWLQHHKQ